MSLVKQPSNNDGENFLKNNNLILLDDDGDLRCKCGLIMKQDTMKTGKDAGRPFAKCPKIIQRCGMFLFLDTHDEEFNDMNRNDAKAPDKSKSKSKSKSKINNFAYENKNNNKTIKKQKCFKCNKTGHWANVCPNS